MISGLANTDLATFEIPSRLDNSAINNYYRTARSGGGDLLAPSSLAGADWPAQDPSTAPQGVRFITADDHQVLRGAALNVAVSVKHFKEVHRRLNLPDLLYAFLMSEAFQFNPRQRIDNSGVWRHRVAKAIDGGAPLRVVWPVLSKIPNFAKQMTGASSATAGEEATFIHLQHLVDLSRQIYRPGIKIILLIDAALYNPAIGNDEVAVRHYIQDLRRLRIEVGALDLELIDYAELLASECAREFHAALQQANLGLAGDIELFQQHGSWLESMRSIVNTLNYPLNYADMRELFSKQRNPSNRWSALVERQSQEGLKRMIAIKTATSEVNLPDKLWPGHLRVTCHWKRIIDGEAVPGLRAYPRYYASSRILPYHGVPLVRFGSHGPVLDIFPEVSLRGRLDLTRVIHANGDTYFYEPK